MDTREAHPFFPAYYMSGVGLSALAEMPLGTDILRFGRGLSFLQAIYLGMCFTGGPGRWVQTPGFCGVVCCTSLRLNQVSHIMDCWEPIIWEVLPFSSLCFFPGLLGNDSQKPAEPIMRGGLIAGVQISARAHTWGSVVTLGAGGPSLAPLPLKPASEISLFEGVNESARYFLPTGRGESSAHV